MDILNVPSSPMAHGLPKSHWDCSFANFDFAPCPDLKILAAKYLAGEKFWLYLHGSTGRGKTHFAVALHRAIVWQHEGSSAGSSTFLEWAELVRTIRASFDDHTYDDVFATIVEAETVVIDDLPGSLADFQLRFVEELVRDRHAMGRRLVVTSNEPFDRFLEKFGSHEVSRIKSICVAMEMGGHDRRLQP